MKNLLLVFCVFILSSSNSKTILEKERISNICSTDLEKFENLAIAHRNKNFRILTIRINEKNYRLVFEVKTIEDRKKISLFKNDDLPLILEELAVDSTELIDEKLKPKIESYEEMNVFKVDGLSRLDNSPYIKVYLSNKNLVVFTEKEVQYLEKTYDLKSIEKLSDNCYYLKSKSKLIW